MSCLSMCACANRYEASSRVLCSSDKNHTSCSLPTPCQGQDPLTAPHCYFFMFVKCGISMHTHTQMSSAVPIFSDTSHSQVRQSLSTRCSQPPWNAHTLFHSPISKPSTFFLINFLKRLFTLNFSCLRVRVYYQQRQNLNNLKKRSALITTGTLLAQEL